MRSLTGRYRRWLRLRKVPRRTYIVASTYERARFAAKHLGVNLASRDAVFVNGPRAIEGMRFLPGDRIMMEVWPPYVRDVIIRNLISSGVSVKSRDLVTFEVVA